MRVVKWKIFHNSTRYVIVLSSIHVYITTSEVMSLSKTDIFHISTVSVLVVSYIFLFIITLEVMSLSKTKYLSHFNKICARCIIYICIYLYIITSEVMSRSKTKHLSHFYRVCARCIIYLFIYNYLGSHVSEQDGTPFTFHQGLCMLYHISKYIITSEVMSLSKTEHLSHFNKVCACCIIYLFIYNYLGSHVSEQDGTSFTFQQGLCMLYHIPFYI